MPLNVKFKDGTPLENLKNNLADDAKSIWAGVKNLLTSKEGIKALAKASYFPFSMMGDPTGGGITSTLDVVDAPANAALPAWFAKAAKSDNGALAAKKYLDELRHKYVTQSKQFVKELTDEVTSMPGFSELQIPVTQSGKGKKIKLKDGFELLNTTEPGVDYGDVWTLIKDGERQKNSWITLDNDAYGVPSVASLRPLPDYLKGQGLGRDAYNKLAEKYLRLRSDPTGATSQAAVNNIWGRIGEKFHDPAVYYEHSPRYEHFPGAKPSLVKEEKKILDKNLTRSKELREMIDDFTMGHEMLNRNLNDWWKR